MYDKADEVFTDPQAWQAILCECVGGS